MTSPSLLSRESTTLSSMWAQKGHFKIAPPKAPAPAGVIAGHLAEAQPLAPEQHEPEHQHGQVRQRVRGDGGRGGRRARHAEHVGERQQVERVEAAHHPRRRDRHAHDQEGDQQERGVERQLDAEGHVVQVEAERDQQPDRERLPGRSWRACGSGARSTARPLAERAQDLAARLGQPARRAREQPLQRPDHALGVGVEREQRRRAPPAPRAAVHRAAELHELEETALDLRGGGRQHEEVDREEQPAR